METKYTAANPFGELSTKVLKDFEQTIQYRLPEDYRKYLLNFNGAEPINTICNISEDEGITIIHGMLGIHDGPEYVQLESNFGDDNSTRKTGLLAFAYDEGGNNFCICLLPKQYGKVYFYDHESSYADDINTLIKIADSFDCFIESLTSREEYENSLEDTDPEFYARLQYARLQYAKNNPQI
ncbi:MULTISPECIES: SMI1/KNR4 family protein [unclassified Psychrobacter]|uniref:SMI1/KNR4 family protein n=2 Tax=Psychrobacter TaxID=497 RepID=UPI0004324ED2|nr:MULTISPECIES: SMI1/KNR4 family protein [unclassified Psychrobacter]MBE8608235.1 SMI1/KNR4 family protein [Pseudomonas lundensis]GAF61086.1 hypothetical protein JCM18903_1052 [Psychrobacter sp. JCM 18903]HCI75874.1 SMI1/KNR4 family protein [Psychrobacter sp.]